MLCKYLIIYAIFQLVQIKITASYLIVLLFLFFGANNVVATLVLSLVQNFLATLPKDKLSIKLVSFLI